PILPAMTARFTDSRLLAAAMAVAVALWTTTALHAYAAEADEDPEADDDAVVVEDIEVLDELPPSSPLFEDPAVTKETIVVAEIRDRIASLADLLEQAAGVRVVSFGGAGRTATASIRGASGRQVLVLLDGVPLNAAGEAVDLSTIPLDQIAVVEIHRGGQGALHGASGVGGVINLITVAPADEEGGGQRSSVRVAAGSFGTVEETLTTSVWGEGPSVLVQLHQLNTRGDFGFTNDNGTVFNPADDFADTRSNNETHHFGALVRPRWADTWGGDLQATAEGFWRTRGEPGIITFPSAGTKLREGRMLLDLTWRGNDWLLPASIAELKAYGRWGSEHFSDPRGEQTGSPFTSDQRDTLLGLRAGTSWASAPDLIWTAMMEGATARFRDADRPSAEHRDALSGAVRAEWMVRGDLTLVGALRGDHFSDAGGQLSPKVGVRWDFGAGWTLQANAGNAFRPPSFQELYQNRGFVVGNPELQPELARTVDLGVSLAEGPQSASATLFWSQTRDLIEYVQLSGFRFKPLNFGRADGRGLELSASWALDERWTAAGDWTLQRVTDESGGANRSGNRIPGRPDHFGNLELRYRDDLWRGALTWAAVGPNALNFANTKTLSGRSTVDLSVGYHTGAWALDLLATNLTGSQIADLRGFPLPSRGWTLAYTRHW
ncbi:MAG TPA: TonB-dependent receptor, partial [bacterium]|nr:TonB-dependent receptor [bacterium]